MLQLHINIVIFLFLVVITGTSGSAMHTQDTRNPLLSC